jgi:release factor glutamine methyltransferase
MKALDTIREITRSLKVKGIESAKQEAEIFIRYGLDINAVEIYRDNPPLTKEQIGSAEKMVERRSRREPLQYIIGYEEFLGLKLIVGPGVLIPRPETELMADHAIQQITDHRSQITDHRSQFTVLDVCTGSGCLALAVAREFPYAEVYGSDISGTAIQYAKKNAETNGIKNVKFLTGSLFEPPGKLSAVNRQQLMFDLIISNPPYIRRDDIQCLQSEIRDWEPLIALDGGADGLDFYRELIPAAGDYLKKDGLVMFELGRGQAESVADMLTSSGYYQIETIEDLAGIERIIQARWKR